MVKEGNTIPRKEPCFAVLCFSEALTEVRVVAIGFELVSSLFCAIGVIFICV